VQPQRHVPRTTFGDLFAPRFERVMLRFGRDVRRRLNDVSRRVLDGTRGSSSSVEKRSVASRGLIGELPKDVVVLGALDPWRRH
jgi:hypothetical protein